jgi:hypothetical protein
MRVGTPGRRASSPPARSRAGHAGYSGGRWLLAASCLAVATLVHAVTIDMAEVRRLAQQPVGTILQGSSFGGISDTDYAKKVNGSPRPVIVIFYADRDEKSRNLATLARYLAEDFSSKIAFYGYRVSETASVDKATLERLTKRYGIRQIPATLFYDNDRGKMELERTDYDVPTVTEYRTPSMLFFRTYYSATHKFITEKILD